mmetsp:Transcript_8077/g.17387  ORF Transcript_8077/g.17387 Transcript_8077/m.17387 type:complete len:376 (-) Transcript_8077:162-1289(-)
MVDGGSGGGGGADDHDLALENPDEVAPTGAVDLALASRRVYLIKLPAFLLEHLEETAGTAAKNGATNPVVAKLRLPVTMDDDTDNALKGAFTLTTPINAPSSSAPNAASDPNKKSSLVMSSAGKGSMQSLRALGAVPPQSSLKPATAGAPLTPREVPREYELRFLPEAPNTLLFSEDLADDKGGVRAEGKVLYQCVAQPKLDNAYLAVNRGRFERALKRDREVARMDDQTLRAAQVDELRPLAIGETAKERDEKRRRAELMKRGTDAPMDNKWRDTMVSSLFEMFERRPYWSLTALLDETNESSQRLKPLVTELCVFNKRGPYSNLYELRDEFKTKRQREVKDDDVRERRQANLDTVRQRMQEMRDAHGGDPGTG